MFDAFQNLLLEETVNFYNIVEYRNILKLVCWFIQMNGNAPKYQQ